MMEFFTVNFRIVFHENTLLLLQEPVNLLYVHTYFLFQRKNPSPWYTSMRGVGGVSKPHVQKGTPHRLPWGP